MVMMMSGNLALGLPLARLHTLKSSGEEGDNTVFNVKARSFFLLVGLTLVEKNEIGSHIRKHTPKRFFSRREKSKPMHTFNWEEEEEERGGGGERGAGESERIGRQGV